MSATRTYILVLVVTILLATQAYAANVYVFSGTNATTDAAAVAVLQSYGHNVTMGMDWRLYDGTLSLAGYDSVYLQMNAYWSTDLPAGGQTALVDYVSNGGGLVTSEWALWMRGGGALVTLSSVFPLDPTTSYDYIGSMTFTQLTSDPILNAGLPATFTCPLNSFAGTRTIIPAGLLKAGATGYYTDGVSYYNLVGWTYGSGRVLMFSTTNGPDQVNDPEFGRLLSNSMDWTSRTVIPEPSGIMVLASCVLGMVGFIRKRK